MRRRDLVWPPVMAGLASCARKRSGPAPTISVGVPPYPSMCVFYLAQERGYFHDAGLDVRPQAVNSTAHATNLLAAGQLDASFGHLPPAFLNAAAAGARLRIVLAREIINPSCGATGAMYARRAAFPEGTADVRLWSGKRFSSGLPAGLAEFLLDIILRRAGLDPQRIPRAGISSAQETAALISGSIDAFLGGSLFPYNFDSHPGIVREDIGTRMLANLQFSYLIFGARLLQGDPEMGGGFLAAYLRATSEFMAGATPQFLKDYVLTNGLSTSVLQQCRAYFVPEGRVDPASVKASLEWAVARGYSTAKLAAESLVDMRFLELAGKILKQLR